MKTPEDIKKGLECCTASACTCNDCPYYGEYDLPFCSDHTTDALAYIEQLESREWELFDLLSTAWFGKGCYFQQDNGTVYSRVSGKYISFDQAIDEFANAITVLGV